MEMFIICLSAKQMFCLKIEDCPEFNITKEAHQEKVVLSEVKLCYPPPCLSGHTFRNLYLFDKAVSFDKNMFSYTCFLLFFVKHVY